MKKKANGTCLREQRNRSSAGVKEVYQANLRESKHNKQSN